MAISLRSIKILSATLFVSILISCSQNDELAKSVPPVQTESELVNPEKLPDEPPPSLSLDDDSLAETNSPQRSFPDKVIRGGGRFCREYVRQKIARMKSPGSVMVPLKNFDPAGKDVSGEMKNDLENGWEESIRAYHVKYGSRDALFVSYYDRAATGIGSNFTSWVIEVEKGALVDFSSLVDKPPLVFWDKKGYLNYYKVDLGRTWWETRDYEHPTVDMELFKIKNGKSQSISKEENIACR